MFNGKTHYKWPFSIAMLVHQRVIFWCHSHFLGSNILWLGVFARPLSPGAAMGRALTGAGKGKQRPLMVFQWFFLMWVCLKMVVYPQWNSHLVGIMISKTIGFFGVHYFQTNPCGKLKNRPSGVYDILYPVNRLANIVPTNVVSNLRFLSI